jgi:magnesium-protoporphyrin IX monomethyl ester aerobic oxidative cyclase
MVATPPKPDVSQSNQQKVNGTGRRESILTPRFYTTDFEAMANMDIFDLTPDYEAILEEFKFDYNRRHFVRTADFNQDWNQIDPQVREHFRVFLEGSCTSEFSGFLLYKEIAVKIKDKNPLMAEIFSLMSRDEARHAGFLNKAMPDFDLQLDLSTLSKTKKYVYFAPKFIFYATYLKRSATGATSRFINISSRILNIASIRSSISLKTGAKMRAATVISVACFFAVSKIISRVSELTFGVSSSCSQYLPPCI